MSSNPYEFSNVDDPAQNTDAVVRSCPELIDKISIAGNLSKFEALRMAARCKAIPARNPKTGKPTSRINGLLVILGGCVLLVFLTASKLVADIKTANFGFESQMFWLTNIAVPVVSIVALIVILRRHRFRIETADPPIWGDTRIELHAKWYSVERYCQSGKLRHALYRWPMIQVLASKDAWLLQPQGLAPVLIPKSWLANGQQLVVEHFLDNLMQWRYLPAAQQALETFPNVFPPLPIGIKFTNGTQQYAEFERVYLQIRPLFPNMPRTGYLYSKPWIWKCWGIGVVLCALCPPACVILRGTGTINLAFLVACLLGWVIYQLGRGTAQNSLPDVPGVITDSTIWLETPSAQTWIPLEHFSQCILVDDILFLSAEKSNIPLGIARSAFSTDADWQAARQRIEAFVTLRKIEDIKVPR